MNEHQLFVFCRSPNICLDRAQMLSKPVGVGLKGCAGGGATPPCVPRGLSFLGGAVMWSGLLPEFEWVWDPLTEVQNLSLSALPMRPF